MRISGSGRLERWDAPTARRPIPSRPAVASVQPLARYDVRLRRELAHRRFVASVARQVLRLGTLHVLDATMVAAAALFAAWLTSIDARPFLPPFIAFVLVGLHLRRAYSPGDARRDPQRLVTGVTVGVLLALIPGANAPPGGVYQEFVALFGLAAIALVLVERRAVDSVVHQAYAHRIGLRRALIIARADEVDALRQGLQPHGSVDDQEIVGFVSANGMVAPGALGTLQDAEALLDAHDVSEVLVAAALQGEELARLAQACFARGARILVIPSSLNVPSGWTELTQLGRLPAYHLHPTRLEFPALLLKRANDLLLATLLLLLSAPLMLLIAAAIKAETRGPVFFRQRRVGLGGRHFSMWKFRSMLHEAEARREHIAHLNAYRDGRLFKLRQDPRVTRVGALLRRFSLDELPQLFNVVAGDMSLVGPRPPLPSEVAAYEPHHFVRLSVMPGLTGPWQVNGRNLITDFEEVVRLERDYIESWSLRADVEIILRTVGVVLGGKGAY